MPQRPRVVCHMMASIDGRIVADRWPAFGDVRGEYESTAATYGADAWMCGRITMEPMAGASRDAEEVAREAASPPAGGRADHVAPGAHRPLAVAVDPSGRLLWQASEVDGDHVVAILGHRVSDSYLAALRQRGVSYLFAGDRPGGQLDLAGALDELATLFGVRTLLLEGGGGINGAMLRDGLVDEVSLLVAPVADGAVRTPSLFDVVATDAYRARRLALEQVERRAAGVVWLRYRVEAPGLQAR